MEHIFFKGPVWESVTRALNAQTGNFVPKKVIQKHNGLRQKQCKWSLLLNHTGLGWDEIIQTTQIVIGTDEVWGTGCDKFITAFGICISWCMSFKSLSITWFLT